MKKWLFALGASVLLHALLIYLLPTGAHSQPQLPQPQPMRVVLKLSPPKKRPSAPAPVALPERKLPPTKEPQKPPKTEPLKPAAPLLRRESPKKPSESPKAVAPQTPESVGGSALNDRSAGGSAAIAAEEPSGSGPSDRRGEGDTVLELAALHVTRKVKPEYPLMSRKRFEEGTVRLLVTIDGGRVIAVKVEKSSGYSRLDRAAEAAVKQWHFSADPSPIKGRIPVVFKIEEP